MDLLSAEFWVAVGQIVMIDILLGGDNAVVIALACRKLPPAQRKLGILYGTAGAIVLRVILIFFALALLKIPFIKIVGALLLLWIGTKLLQPESEEGHGNIQGSDRLWAAVKTVIVADFVMSVDNVIAIAGAAQNAGGGHQMPLVIFGLLVSIPIIVWGSQLVIGLMERFPIIITFGAMLLGWIAGGMAIGDPILADVAFLKAPWAHEVAAVLGALLVLGLGKWLASRQSAGAHAPPHGATATAAGAPEPAGGRGAALKRVLLAVDGSEGAAHAAQRVITLRDQLRDPDIELHLINVQRPVSRDVSNHVARDTLDEYHRERGAGLIAKPCAMLDAAGLKYEKHHRVGEPGASIAEAARTLGCDLIVMGTRGLGSHTGALVGSVAQSTVAHADVPVMLVR